MVASVYLILLLSVSATEAELKEAIEESQAIASSCLIELESCGAHKRDLRDLLLTRDREIAHLREALTERPAPEEAGQNTTAALVVVAVAGGLCASVGGGVGAHFDGARGALIGGGGGSLLCAAVAVTAHLFAR